jgi:hypothetical protein
MPYSELNVFPVSTVEGYTGESFTVLISTIIEGMKIEKN